jgi:tetratricopeptide (TPR) repeat protein
MKPKLYIFPLIALLGLVLFSCKTASKLYEKGNYDEAVELAAKKLQKDPDDPKLLDLIQHAYRYAVNDHETRIRDYSQSNRELKWEDMHREYQSLQKMYEAIYRVPSVITLVNPVNYTSYLITYAEKAATVRYERGLAFMQRYDKQSYRSAYREFQAALRYKPDQRDILQKLNEAWEYAVTNVVILPMQQYGGFVYSSYQLGADNLDDQLLRNLQYNTGNEFVKFYSPWDARSHNIRVDQEIEMRLSTVDIGHFRDQRSKRTVSKEVVVKETVYKPDSVVKEYARVSADIFTTRRTMQSVATLQVTVRDQNGRWLWNDHFTGNHNWNTEFASYTGDARALSESDKQLINRRHEQPPTENEIMRCLLDEINNNTLHWVRNYFSRI